MSQVGAAAAIWGPLGETYNTKQDVISLIIKFCIYIFWCEPSNADAGSGGGRV